PGTKVPPISGTSSRVGYAITNLDLSGFRLRKEDVEVQLIDLSNGLEDAVKTGGSSGNGGSGGDDGGGGGGGGDGGGGGGELAAVPWASLSRGGRGEGDTRQQQQEAPHSVAPSAVPPRPQPTEGEEHARKRGPDGFYHGGGAAAAAAPVPVVAEPREDMKPAEVLRVVARGVRAEFKTLQWACRQETFPYTRGTGTADATVVDGYVSLGFSIKRGIVDREKGVEGPLLVLSTRTVTLNRLDLTVANCRMAWLINLLTRLFSGTISTYVCRSLQEELDGHASDLLGTLN
ncbi:unnamed protein product, partial [Laminaria digitata]